MRALYSAALYAALPLLFARMLWRSRRSPAYRERWEERLGFGAPMPADARVIWVHAVSVGEVQAALPLLEALRGRYPDARILVTTTTPTGAARVRARAGAGLEHRYLPFDLPGAVDRFLDRAAPVAGVVMETELWPNLVAACHRRGVPLVLANARLSARSAAAYARFPRLTGPMLGQLDAIAAQGTDDAERLVSLGAEPDRVTVCGSVKFDMRVSAAMVEQGRALRARWGPGRSVFIAASTHEGEEEPLLGAFARILERVPDCLLVLVPRHPERFEVVAALARRRGFSTAQRTAAPPDCAALDVFIGDTMGELQAFYAGSDVAFVGGSLVETGGHNVLEPAALGLPVVHGPHCFNFADIVDRLGREGAAVAVPDAHALADAVSGLLCDAERRHAMGERGRRFVERNRGSLERVESIDAATIDRA